MSTPAAALPGLPFGLEWRLLLIPLITGIIGYLTNWVAIQLLFRPIDYVGVRVPGMKELAPSFPRKLKQIPGVVEGRADREGMIPCQPTRPSTTPGICLSFRGNAGASSFMPGTLTPT